MAECACNAAEGKVVEGVFEGAAHLFLFVESLFYAVLQWDVAVFYIGGEGSSPHAVAVVVERSRGGECIFAHPLIGLPDVEAAYPFYVCVGYGGNAMVADHGGCVAVPAGEDGEPATLFIFCDEALHHVCRCVGGDDVEQRMQGAVGVPHAVVVVIGVSGGNGLDCASRSETRIAAVHIVESTWQHGCPVEGAVELGLFVRSGAFHLYHPQTPVPYVGEFGAGAFEIGVRNLGFQIAQRPFGVGER